MRNIVSAFVCVLILCMLSGPVIAGNAAECEVLKQGKNKSLYGLCIAWFNADDAAKDRIAAKFKARSGYDITDLFDPLPDPDPDPEAGCPCWGEVELLEATCNHVLTYSAADRAVFDENFISFFNFATSCVYSNVYKEILAGFPTSLDENLTCQAGIDALVNGTLLDMCP